MNTVRKQESTEAPTPITNVSVQFFKKSSVPSEVTKFVQTVNGIPSTPPLNQKEVALGEAYLTKVDKELPASIEASLAEALVNKGVTSGPEYLLFISLDKVSIAIRRESTLTFETGEYFPTIGQIAYQASLYRSSDKKVMWRAILNVSHIGKKIVDVPTTGGQMATKVVAELQSAGWVK